MRIVPLDSEKRQILDCFLELAKQYPGTAEIYKKLYEKVKQKGNFKKPNSHISKKISRIFLDIYKRICIKYLKKDPQTMHFSREMETKIYSILRFYEELTSKNIFLRLCHRYSGNKELGRVTEQQEIQFYEEISTKFEEKFEKQYKIDFFKDFQEPGEIFKKEKLDLLTKGAKKLKKEQTESNYLKIEKFWKTKLEAERLKTQQTSKKEEINNKIEAQQKTSETNQHQQQNKNDDYEIKLELKDQEPRKAEQKKDVESNFQTKSQENIKTKKMIIPNPSKKSSKKEIKQVKDPKQINRCISNQDGQQQLQIKNQEKPRKIRKPVENE